MKKVSPTVFPLYRSYSQKLGISDKLIWVTPAKDISPLSVISAILINGLIWYEIAELGQPGSWLAVLLVVLLILLSFYFLAKRQLAFGLMILTYLAVTQPAIRESAPQLPYLLLEYLSPFWLFLFLRNYRDKFHFTLPALIYGAYIFLELTGILGSVSLNYGRGIFIPSLTLFFFLILSANIKMTPITARYLLSGYMVGMGGIAALMSRIYLTGAQISWFNESNFSTSGDMGPVQVSMLLSVGVFISLLFLETKEKLLKLFFGVFAILLSYLMLLTFSRNGLYLLILATLSYFLVFNRFNIKVFLALIAFVIIGNFIFQLVSEQTGGVAVTRYSDFSTSNRTTLVKYGWQIFLDNPLLGVGTGNYYSVVSDAEYFGRASGAHNELIRAASEHGVLGLVLWLFFALSSFYISFEGSIRKVKAFRITFLLIGVAYMFVNGLKLFIQPVLFFLALAQYVIPDEK